MSTGSSRRLQLTSAVQALAARIFAAESSEDLLRSELSNVAQSWPDEANEARQLLTVALSDVAARHLPPQRRESPTRASMMLWNAVENLERIRWGRVAQLGGREQAIASIAANVLRRTMRTAAARGELEFGPEAPQALAYVVQARTILGRLGLSGLKCAPFVVANADRDSAFVIEAYACRMDEQAGTYAAAEADRGPASGFKRLSEHVWMGGACAQTAFEASALPWCTDALTSAGGRWLVLLLDLPAGVGSFPIEDGSFGMAAVLALLAALDGLSLPQAVVTGGVFDGEGRAVPGPLDEQTLPLKARAVRLEGYEGYLYGTRPEAASNLPDLLAVETLDEATAFLSRRSLAVYAGPEARAGEAARLREEVRRLARTVEVVSERLELGSSCSRDPITGGASASARQRIERAISAAATAVSRLLHEEAIDHIARATWAAAACRGTSPREWDEVQHLLPRLAEVIERLPGLSVPNETTALLRADVLGLQARHEDALAAAESSAFSTVAGRAAALMVRIQAYGCLGRFPDALRLRDDFEVLRREVPSDRRFELEVLWLRTLISAKSVSSADVAGFLAAIEPLLGVARLKDGPARPLLEDLVHGLRLAGHWISSRSLLHLLIERTTESARLVQYHLWSAAIELEAGDGAAARQEIRRAEGLEPPTAQREWPLVRGMRLAESARVLGGLAERDPDSEAAQSDWLGAHDAIVEAIPLLRRAGDAVSQEYLCMAHALAGRISLAVGKARDAVEAYRTARTLAEDWPGAPLFCADEYNEASALVLDGRFDDAVEVLDGLLRRPGLPEQVHGAATALREYVQCHVLSVATWLNGPDGRAMGDESARVGTREMVSHLARPLLAWWDLWSQASGIASSTWRSGGRRQARSAREQIISAWLRDGDACILDYWGRGGLARLAAVLRGDPFGSLSVDAYSIDEVRRWAEALCPLSDTLVVRWKGGMTPGRAFFPACDEARLGMGFGGHGYVLTADYIIPNWVPGGAWCNLLPQNVVAFLKGEARGLLESGRLVVIPAPLAGCTQRAAGWTDALFTEQLCGGITTVVKQTPAARPPAGDSRVVDLAQIAVPYMTGVPLRDLAGVLDECEPWLAGLRSAVWRAVGDDLRWENWAKVRALASEFRDAMRQLSERLGALATRHGRGRWKVSRTEGQLTAGATSTDGEVPSGDELTERLREVARSSPSLAPWVPYWRLGELGGHLDWLCGERKRSTPPDSAFLRSAGQGQTAVSHTWLHPGTSGEAWLFVKERG